MKLNEALKYQKLVISERRLNLLEMQRKYLLEKQADLESM